jgi:glycosyltransferase involved in cell wall biosynthesis
VPDVQVVVVDDGSTDGTAAVAAGHGAIVLRHEVNRGLGAALRSGFAKARELNARAAVYLDADGEYDPAEAASLLQPIEAGEADYVLGSRFMGRIEGMTRPRRVANRAFSLLLSGLCGRYISDGQTGFRAFSRRALDVAEIVHDYNYAQVLTLDLLHKGMRLREAPVSYRRRTTGRSFVSAEYLWRVPVGMLREVLSD